MLYNSVYYSPTYREFRIQSSPHRNRKKPEVQGSNAKSPRSVQRNRVSALVSYNIYTLYTRSAAALVVPLSCIIPNHKSRGQEKNQLIQLHFFFSLSNMSLPHRI